MEKSKNFIILIALLLGAFSISFNACTDELVKADYDYKPDGTLALSVIELDSVVKVSDESISLFASLNDVGQSEIYDQGFVYSENEDFSDYKSISTEIDTIASALKLIKKNHEISQGKTLYFKAFVMAKDGIVFSNKAQSVFLPVTWEKVGEVIFTDNTFSGETYNVEIQKFSGRDEYRLVDPFQSEEANFIRFFLDENWNAASVPDGLQSLGTDPYLLYWHSDYVGQYCVFANNANVYSMDFLLYNSSDQGFYLGSIKFEWIDGYPGDIPEPQEPVAVSYKTDFSTEADRAGWVLDKFSGVEETDVVWYFDMAKAGAPSWGTAIASYYNGAPLKIISPLISVAENDTLSFGLYSGLFGSDTNAKVKVYIREDGAAFDSANPVKDWDLPNGGGATAIPLTDYEGKKVKVIFVIEQGDFLFYHFAVAASSDAELIFQ